MQFLTAKSRWMTFLLAKYSMPLAICKHMPTRVDTTESWRREKGGGGWEGVYRQPRLSEQLCSQNSVLCSDK